MSERLTRYLLSNAGIGGALGAIGLIGGYLADWLPLSAPLLWGLTLCAYGAGAGLGYALTTTPETLPDGLGTQDTLAWLRVHALPKLPGEARPLLQTILDRATALMPRIKELERAGNVDPESRAQLKQTLLKHLPNSIETYLRLPPVYARVTVASNGKTPYQLLMDQLGLLSTGLEDLERRLYAGELNQLLAQSQLLEQKFGDKALF